MSVILIFFFKVKTNKPKAITESMEKLIKITEGDDGSVGTFL